MKQLLKYMVAAPLLLGAASAMPYTECTKNVWKVWTPLQNNAVWICFTDGSCIFGSGSQYSDEERARIVAMASSAMLAGHKVRVRYPETDPAVCSDVTDRDDSQGFWVLNF